MRTTRTVTHRLSASSAHRSKMVPVDSGITTRTTEFTTGCGAVRRRTIFSGVFLSATKFGCELEAVLVEGGVQTRSLPWFVMACLLLAYWKKALCLGFLRFNTRHGKI